MPPFVGRDASVNGALLSTVWAQALSDSDNASSVAAAVKTSSSGFAQAAFGKDSTAAAATAPSARRAAGLGAKLLPTDALPRRTAGFRAAAHVQKTNAEARNIAGAQAGSKKPQTRKVELAASKALAHKAYRARGHSHGPRA